MSLVQASNLGFPRMGKRRELKFALEKYWSGESNEDTLLQAAQTLRKEHWQLQAEAGINAPPSNDFSLYDHVLDMAITLGAIPRRFKALGWPREPDALILPWRADRKTATALDMTKWFDTNYHYVVPEFEAEMRYELRSNKVVEDYLEARALGIETRPVLLGPVSFVLLGKPTDARITRAQVLHSILPLYQELLTRLSQAGAEWVQIDEPYLTLDLDFEAEKMYREAYRTFDSASMLPKLLLATYFGALGGNLNLALELGTAGLHLDLVRAPEQLDALLSKDISNRRLSLGLVDGRNVWRTDLTKALELLETAVRRIGKDHLEVAPSCSLLHSPVDLDAETKLDPEVRGWMAFAKQKLNEVALLAKASEGQSAIHDELSENAHFVESRRTSQRIHKPEVEQRLAAIDAEMLSRESTYKVRQQRQAKALSLPNFPTTTIGSFPQTAEVRKMRVEFSQWENPSKDL